MSLACEDGSTEEDDGGGQRQLSGGRDTGWPRLWNTIEATAIGQLTVVVLLPARMTAGGSNLGHWTRRWRKSTGARKLEEGV